MAEVLIPAIWISGTVIGIFILWGLAGVLDDISENAEWRREREASGHRETFTCIACRSGPWDRGWDPHEQPMTSLAARRRGLGLCPNCSGAD